MSKQLQTVEVAHSLDFCFCLNEMKKKIHLHNLLVNAMHPIDILTKIANFKATRPPHESLSYSFQTMVSPSI